MKPIDTVLNTITMYRLVVYVLGAFAGVGLLFSLIGRLSISPSSLIISAGLLIASTYATDWFCARLTKAPVNSESWLITALIIFFVLQPATSVSTGTVLVLAGVISGLSKCFLTWNDKHIFNPAALAAAVVSLTGLQASSWWIGSSVFWPLTLICGLLVVRKIKRLPLLFAFAGVSIVLQAVIFVAHHEPLGIGMKGALIASPLIFLGTIMLTEPATMPPRRRQQIIFGSLVAVLYVFAWRLGPIEIYPEVALLIGNVYAFMVSPKWRTRLKLMEAQRISEYVYNYVFMPERTFAFQAGQYMEWTLRDVPFDSRGNRRTFTIASSPTENTIQVGLKYYRPASSYKAAFSRLQVGDVVYASQLAGNFTVDWNQQTKLAFVAGGIGITPFRSMVKYMVDNDLQRDIVLLYVVSNAEELAYDELFKAARIRYVPVVTGDDVPVPPGAVHAKLSQELIGQLIPDYAERTFYISGPNQMVDGTKTRLQHGLSVPRRHIITDHFSGY